MKLIARTIGAVGGALFIASFFAAAASADITNNTNTATQTGANVSVSQQTSAAVSGNATAADDGVATSGAASSGAVFEASQSLSMTQYNQTDAGGALDIDTNTNTATQAAANALGNAQASGAASGIADASDGGTATTGDADSFLLNVQAQTQTLLQSNQSVFPVPAAP